LVFTAVRWSLLEVSLVGVGADMSAGIRSLGGAHDTIGDIRARMEIRSRMTRLQRMYDKQEVVFGNHRND
jgi:hypothetical protein